MHLGTPGQHFDGSEVSRTPNRTPWGPDLHFIRFLMDLEAPWDQLWINFDDFSVIWITKLQYGFQSWFLVIWKWTWHQDAMSGCVQNVVNTVVFVRFTVL